MNLHEIAERLKAAGLDRFVELALKEAAPCIRFRTVPLGQESLAPGSSKAGGNPDLPDDVEWPRKEGRPLSFILQINLTDLHVYECAAVLPSQGLLSIFYDAEDQPWGFDPKDRDGWKVMYSDAPATALGRRDSPQGDSEALGFRECRLFFEPFVSLPPWEVFESVRPKLTDDEFDLLEAFQRQLQPEDATGLHHRMLGHPDRIQGDMTLECQLVSHGLYCGNASGYEDARAEKLEETKHVWKLLLQVDTDDNAEMMWGDMGRLYFWIREEDLARRDFDKAWMILQCS